MKYNEIPKPWKQRISGSINFFIIDIDYNNLEYLLEIWTSRRIIKDETGIYFVTSDPFTPQKFQLTEELYEELIQIITERFKRRMNKI
jgi:hypothetical protein